MRVQENASIRNCAKEAGVFWWQVANAIGVSEGTLIRWLRTPLSAEKEQLVLSAIHELEVVK